MATATRTNTSAGPAARATEALDQVLAGGVVSAARAARLHKLALALHRALDDACNRPCTFLTQAQVDENTARVQGIVADIRRLTEEVQHLDGDAFERAVASIIKRHKLNIPE